MARARIAAPTFELRLALRHVWHDGGRNTGSLALQQPFAGFLPALLRLPMRRVVGIAGQNQLGLLMHVSIPLPHNDDLQLSVPLSMDGEALSVMGSSSRREMRRATSCENARAPVLPKRDRSGDA